MKTFKDPHDGKPFLAQLIDGPGKGCTLSFFEVAGPGTKSFFVPRNKVAEARRAYNRPHLPEMLLSFAEGLSKDLRSDRLAAMDEERHQEEVRELENREMEEHFRRHPHG